jgi:pimeloyl-ACP methyl ester carboxylesterase
MPSRAVPSRDGTRIAFDFQGAGPPLMLLHGGFIQNRRSWHDAGYVNRLSRDFTVITLDLRGHGESDKPIDSDAYTAEKLIGDVLSIADACGATRFCMWGFSLGATITLQVAAKSKRVARVVVAGSYFGRIFSEEEIARLTSGMEAAAKAQEEGRLDELPLSHEQRSFAEQVDLRIPLATYRALGSWPAVEPKDLRCPTLIYAGTEDQMISQKLKDRAEEIEAAGLALAFFDGLDHMQEFSEIEKVLPPVRAFLRGGIPSLSAE